VIPIDVLCLNFVKFGRRGIGEIMHCLPEKNSLGFPAVATSDCARNLSGQPRQCTQSAQDFIQIGSLSAEL